MRAERFGSYSMVATVPCTPYLSRRKSMIRYIRLLPPPRNREVIRPLAFRPPLFFSGSSSDFSGLSVVSSEYVDTDRKRREGVVGLYCRNGMVVSSYSPSNSVMD